MFFLVIFVSFVVNISIQLSNPPQRAEESLYRAACSTAGRQSAAVTM
jgi:hypothetical protein